VDIVHARDISDYAVRAPELLRYPHHAVRLPGDKGDVGPAADQFADQGQPEACRPSSNGHTPAGKGLRQQRCLAGHECPLRLRIIQYTIIECHPGLLGYEWELRQGTS
jgi:hypothetical protein